MERFQWKKVHLAARLSNKKVFYHSIAKEIPFGKSPKSLTTNIFYRIIRDKSSR
jgi:hypothetical protein